MKKRTKKKRISRYTKATKHHWKNILKQTAGEVVRLEKKLKQAIKGIDEIPSHTTHRKAGRRGQK